MVHWLHVLHADVTKEPLIADSEKYGQQWWSWWGSLQPEWRMRNHTGRPVIGGCGEWEVLKKPGKNGLRIVLLSLAWWGLRAKDRTLEDFSSAALKEWSSAAKDVAWVIFKMAAWVTAKQR